MKKPWKASLEAVRAMEWERATEKKDGSYYVPTTWVYSRYYEAFNLLFRIENALRVFAYVVLKNEYGGKWVDLSVTSDEAGEGSIGSIARRRISQASAFGYLGYSIPCPLMYLTGGVLICAVRQAVSKTEWLSLISH